MKSILEIIKPIKLLAGSHLDTAQTGQGCFMNVIAYLNGETQITDRSTCVCVTIRPIAIWLNDFMSDDARYRLLPFIQRAMGTATDDEKILSARLQEVVKFANDMACIASKGPNAYAAATYAAATYADAATYDAANTAAYAATYAATYAYAANATVIIREEIIDRGIQFLELVCPKADCINPVLVERANKLVELSS